MFTGNESKDELNGISKKAVKKIKREIPEGTCSDCSQYHYTETCMNQGIETKPWNTCKHHKTLIRFAWVGLASTFIVILLINLI